ncbi:unnamed protein product [Schistosoma rodhaini]|uniref:Homeobox domain-containing protein n=1 Tax=Schistosoma rodhaini TaxID=6188 RepID=A0AA85G2S8_9TREM|nr:unnamed protein product [Schistosoma rodhaini]
MNTTDIQSMKSEWKTDCTITCIPQESINRNQSQINNLTITELSGPSIHSQLTIKPLDSYDNNKTNYMINSTSSSSSSPSLSFNRPKSLSPSLSLSYDDANRILLNDLEYGKQIIDNNNNNNTNKLNLMISTSNDSNNHCGHEDDDHDHDDSDPNDEDHENGEETNGYNPIEISHLSVYKHCDKQCDPPPPVPPPPPPPHPHHQHHHSTFYSPKHESTDMMPLTKKSRISSSNELNCIRLDNDLNQSKLHHIEDDNDDTVILTTTSHQCTSSITTSSKSLFHSIEFGISNTPISNETIDLQYNSGFRPRFQYPHQYHSNYQSNNNDIEQNQSSYHNDTTCQSTSPLHNYFSSFTFNHLPYYYHLNSKHSNQYDLNNGHELLNSSILNGDNGVDYLHKSNMNTSSSSNNSNDNYSNNINTTNNNGLMTIHRNPSHITTMTTTTTNNNNSSTITTPTGEQFINGRHMIPSFHSSIINTMNENNNPITFPSVIPNLSLNQTNPLTMSSSSAYTRNLNDCRDNISKLSNINWTSNNTSSHPYRGQIGYSNEFANTTRRRNATKESTTTLKAWLQEHIKNPYPTKGEKIMLAIITKMTLTQVSTWFANARRRLKKENKMTWTPKHRGEEQNDEDDDDDADDDDDDDDDNDDDREVNDGDNDMDNDEGHRNEGCRITNHQSIYHDIDTGNDGDVDDEMTGSEEDLNLTKLPYNQSRNHATLKDSTNHNYYRNYSLNKNGKLNKFIMKSDSFKPSYHKNGELYIENELLHKRKQELFHNYTFIQPPPPPPPSSSSTSTSSSFPSSSSSNSTFLHHIQPFDFFLNDQYDKMNSTLNSLNTFNKQHYHHHSLQATTSSSSSSTSTQLNHSIVNHLNEYQDKAESKLVNSSECNLSNWTDTIPTSISINKYDSIPFGQQSYQNLSFPYYMQENLHVSPYIHGLDTSNKVYSSFNPIISSTNLLNSNKTNHLSSDISLLSPSTLSSSSSPPSTCSPLSSLSLITSTTTTVTTTTNSIYTNFPNTMHLLTSKSFPLSNNNHSQLINPINTIHNHDRISFTNLFNPKDLLSSKMNSIHDNYGTNIDSMIDNNNYQQQRLPFLSEINNNNNNTTSITIPSTMTISTINSLWSSQLKQLTRLDDGGLDNSSDQIVGSSSNSSNSSVTPFQQFINSSLSIPFTTTDNHNNNYTTINNSTTTMDTTNIIDNHMSNISNRQFTQDDLHTLSSTLWSNERLNTTYNTELNHNTFYQPICNSMYTMPTR